MQAEAAAEAKLKGPHAFPLERLLGIFWELHAATGEAALDSAERRDLQSADVLLQISSLVSLRFLSQASSLLVCTGLYPLTGVLLACPGPGHDCIDWFTGD